MSFTKINPADYASKGIRVKNNPLGLPVAAAQRAFDEMTLDVVIPKFNALSGELDNSVQVEGVRLASDGQIEVKDNGVWSKPSDAKVDKVSGKGLSSNDFTNQYKQNLDSCYQDKHSHSNKSLLDSYTQSNEGLTSAVNQAHAHSNKSVLDGISEVTQVLGSAADKVPSEAAVAANIHYHTNKSALDKISDVTQNLGSSTDKVPSEAAVANAIQSAGGGDMMKAIYDTGNKNTDIFQWATGTFSNPNMLINGDFQVWQRGTSFTIAEAGYTADRWRCSLPAGTIVEKSTDVPEDSLSGQSVKITLSESSSGSLRQYFEIPRVQLIGKTFTLSCWIKGPAGASASIDIADASTGAVALDGTWQKFIKTATLTSTSTSSFFVSVMRNGNTPGEYYVSDVKLECGSIATPFVPRLYGEELAACQRYLQVFDSYSLKTGSAYTSKAIYLVYPLFAAMRAKPSLANVPDTATINVRTVTGQHSFSVSSTDITVDRASDATAQIKITLPDNTDVTAGTPIAAYFPSGAGVWLLDAEA